MTAPTYFELTNNGDLFFESVNTKEKFIASKEKKSTPTDQNLGMILKPFKVWYLKDFKGVLIVHRLVTKSTVHHLKKGVTLR
jgi:hypothetical protein